MKKIAQVLLLSILLVSCASVGIQMGPSYKDWDTGEKTRDFKLSFVNNHAFAPSTTNTLMKKCKNGEESTGMSEEEILAVSFCRPMDEGRHDVGAGILPGFGSAVIESSAIVGAAYFIGKGIGKSGDRITNTRTDNSQVQAWSDAEADSEADASSESDINFHPHTDNSTHIDIESHNRPPTFN